ncbi:hypothetical protein ACVW0I_003462 [Bradyrhizobium sp. LM6.11]
MVADSDSNIAWHRVQLKKNRAELKALETARFTMGEIAASKRSGQTQKAIGELKRKIAQSERAVADHDKRTRRPLTHRPAKPQQRQLEQLGRLLQSAAAQGWAALAGTTIGFSSPFHL